MAALAAAALVSAPSSLASTEGHAYSFSFGSSGTGSGQFGGEFGEGVGIDQSTGNVYVADTANHRIEKFSASGTFLSAWGYGVLNGSKVSQVCNAPASCQAGISGAAPGQFINPTAVAVDNSGGPNDGNVYIADTGNAYGAGGLSAVLKFSPDGIYLGRINGEDTPDGVFDGLPWNGALAMDGHGNLFVTTGQRVMKFDGEDNEYVGGSEWTKNGVFSIAVNPGGSKLIVTGYVPSGNEGTYIVNSNGTAPGLDFACGSYFAGDATFDPVTNHFLVGSGNAICEITQSGEHVRPPFGANALGSVAGIAVNETTGDVYVMDWGQARVSVFVPRVVADVETEPAKDVQRTTATLVGHVTPDPSGGGDVTDCHFDYVLDSVYQEVKPYTSPDDIFKNYGTSVACAEPTPYSGSTAVSKDLTGLTVDAKYRYRLVAKNSIDANAGAERTFTPHRVIGLTTGAASNLTTISARLNGSFDPSGEETNYKFEWGPDTSYGNVTPAGTPVTGTGTKTVFADLTGLSNYTKYHYRIVASNSLGTSYGDDEILRTFPPLPPDVGTPAVSQVTSTGAHLSSTVNPNLGLTIYRFQYGTTTGYGVETPVGEPLEGDESSHSVSTDLSGLEPGTTYHVRFVATNFGGTSPSSDLVFTTQAAPGVVDTEASSVGTGGATLEAVLSPNLSPTTFHFEYGASTAYGSRTAESPSIWQDDVPHAVSVAIGGLAEGTTYHFRVVATNGIGTTTGPDHTFITRVTPTQSLRAPLVCRKGFVKRHGKCVKKPKRRKAKNRKTKHQRHSNEGRG